MQDFSIFCDESCHLEKDDNDVMFLSAIYCPKSEVIRISNEIKKIQDKFNKTSEIKWVKISPADIDFYVNLVDYFYSESSLLFRIVIVNNKKNLNHNVFNNGSHDEFYYKMYYLLLEKIIIHNNKYKIYIDKKDTRSSLKCEQLKKILRNKIKDFNGEYLEDIRIVSSHQIRILQLADLLMGAVSYEKRNLKGNLAKEKIVEILKNKTNSDLKKTSFLNNKKFNIFSFNPEEPKNE